MESLGLTILVLVLFALLAGALTRFSLSKVAIPYSVALLLLGLLLGYVVKHQLISPDWLISQGVIMVANIDPHLILFLFLPALIFESAFAIEVHLFKRMFWQIILLAVPGLIVATLITALLVKFAFPWQWSWPIAFMFGALISATDPVAVVALLKETSSRKRLETLIEGESLMNDGTAIVFFSLFYALVLQGATIEQLSLTTFAGQFLWVVTLGCLVGAALAGICLLWLGHIFNDATTEIIITLVAAYLAFFIAEHYFHASGVVAVVLLGLILASAGRTRISPEVESSLHHFWQMMSYIFNTLIFLIVGFIVAYRISFNHPEWWFNLLLLYLAIQIIRAFSITLFMPLLARIGIGITKGKAIVLTWGGLRGAVALALALVVGQNPDIPLPLREQILFLTSGIVVLTIVINGSSIKWLLDKLGMAQLPAAKQVTLNQAKNTVNEHIQQNLSTLQQDEFLRNANWDKIQQDYLSAPPAPVCNNHQDVQIAFYRQLLESERTFYWQQFHAGLLPGSSVRLLIAAVEQALDGEPNLSHRPMLKTHWKQAPWLKALAKIAMTRRWFKKEVAESTEARYNSARGFIQSQQFLVSIVTELAPDEVMAEQVRKILEANIQLGYQVIEKLKRRHANMVRQVQHFSASRVILNQQRSAIEKLAHQGIIDESEAEKLICEVEDKMQQLKVK